MDHFLEAWRNYANFEGRSTRSDYWYFNLFNGLICLALQFVDAGIMFSVMDKGLSPYNPLMYGLCSIVYGLATFIPSFSLTVRRLHDVGNSGWFMLVGVLPPIIAALIIVVIVSMNPIMNYQGLIVTSSVLMLASMIGPVIMLYKMCCDSEEGGNAWGANPKGYKKWDMSAYENEE